jgi:hypothetical protein
VSVAVVLLTAALVVVFALLAAVGAGKLARLDGASYPSAVRLAAAAFTATLTLASAITAAIVAVHT